MKGAAQGALVALWIFTVLALVGFATFGMNPALLARFPALGTLYAPAFRFFAVGQVWLAWGALALLLAAYAGWRWLPAFVAIYGISLASELVGTGYGLPFGAYEYTSLLQPSWLGRVPVVIPLSWFYMALASWVLAGRLLRRGGAGGRIVLAAAALVAWDLALDPAMSHVVPYWVWAEGGPYYGMPWINLFGWALTALVLMGVLSLLRVERYTDRLPVRWVGSFYLANLALPVGMNAAAGLWGAVAVTLIVTGGGGYLVWRLGGQSVGTRLPLGRAVASGG
jgi:uncharacterized membrane protein